MQPLDECLFGISKHQKTHVNIVAQDVAVLDEMFAQLVKTAYHNREENTKVDQAILDMLLAYVQGKEPTYGTSWINARAVYIPLCVQENY